jgi:hypothetical protein
MRLGDRPKTPARVTDGVRFLILRAPPLPQGACDIHLRQDHQPDKNLTEDAVIEPLSFPRDRAQGVRSGTLKKQLALYERFGWEIQRKHLGDPLAFLITETGNVNSYIHIWQYNDAEDRVRKRARLADDPAWQLYLERAGEAGYILSQETSLLVDAPFFGR